MPGVRGVELPPAGVHRPLRIDAARLLAAVDVMLADGGRDARTDVRPGIIEFAARHVDGWSVVSLLTGATSGPADVLGARGVALVPFHHRLTELVRAPDRELVVLVLHDDHLTVGDRSVPAHSPGPPPPRPAPDDPPSLLLGLDEDVSARFLDPSGRVLRVNEAWTARVRRFGPARFHGFAAAGRRYVQATAARFAGELAAALVMPATVVNER